MYNKDPTAYPLQGSGKRLPTYLVSLLTLHTKIISRWIADQNVKKKTVTFPGVNLHDHEVTKDVSHRTKNTSHEGNIDELDFIEIKYLSSPTTPIRVQKQDTELVKSFVIHPSDKGLIARMPKNYCKSIGKG